MSELPHRDAPLPTGQCRCVLYDDADRRVTCPKPQLPDSPFCRSCADRHPTYSHVKVGVR